MRMKIMSAVIIWFGRVICIRFLRLIWLWATRAAAERALDFLLKVQQKPDGSFPQNSWLDGKPFWGSLQMDEVAYPLIMAYQLKRFDKETYTETSKTGGGFYCQKRSVNTAGALGRRGRLFAFDDRGGDCGTRLRGGNCEEKRR